MMYQVQSVHTVFTSATLSCLGSLLFSQGQQCSVLATCALRSIAPLRPSTYMPFARVPAHCLPCPLLTRVSRVAPIPLVPSQTRPRPLLG